MKHFVIAICVVIVLMVSFGDGHPKRRRSRDNMDKVLNIDYTSKRSCGYEVNFDFKEFFLEE